MKESLKDIEFQHDVERGWGAFSVEATMKRLK